jgi:hypothetical protein
MMWRMILEYYSALCTTPTRPQEIWTASATVRALEASVQLFYHTMHSVDASIQLQKSHLLSLEPDKDTGGSKAQDKFKTKY